VHGGDAHDWLVFVNRPDRVSNRGNKRGRVSARTDHQRLHVVHPGPLHIRRVEGIRLVGCERQLLYVLYHADDGVPRLVSSTHFRTHANALPDRVLTRKLAPGKGLADHHRARSARAVALVEQASATQRNAHSLEIAWSHCIAKCWIAGLTRV